MNAYLCCTSVQGECWPSLTRHVEQSFCERGLRSEKQHSMQHGTHKAHVLFGLNGVVPPP